MLIIPRLVRDIIIGNDVLYKWKVELDFNECEVRMREGGRLIIIKLLQECINDGDNYCREIHEERFFVEDLSFNVIDVDDDEIRNSYPEVELIEKVYDNADENNGVVGKDEDDIERIIEVKILETENISEEQKEKLRKCLKQNIAVFSSKPGLCDKYVHKFSVEGIIPYGHKSRPIPNSIRSQAKAIISNKRLLQKAEYRQSKVKRGKSRWIPKIGDEILVRNFCLLSTKRSFIGE